MLVVVCAIVYLYASAGVSLLSAWRQSKRDAAQVSVLQRQHVLLQRQHDALLAPGVVQTQARRLGFVRPGERTYVVSGLPAN